MANKKHAQIEHGYDTWNPSKMKDVIDYGVGYLPIKKSVYTLLIIEWWLHNIGYYITKPFIFVPAIKKLNLRFKDVDLMIKVIV